MESPGDSTSHTMPSSPSDRSLCESPATIATSPPGRNGGESNIVVGGSGGNDSSPSNNSTAFPMRKRLRRNPAVLIRWIEEHPFNPYPTKAEKQGLAFYAGMTQRQLNDWFANARRNIKKVGYENWKKKHNGFSAILSGIPLSSSNCGLSILSPAATTTSTSGSSASSSTGINSSFTGHPFTNAAFTISPLNRPMASFSASAPGGSSSVMSYPPPSSNGPMSLGMATCVKPTPLSSSGFVKVESGGGAAAAYGGGSYGLAAGDAGGGGSGGSANALATSSASSFCLPFSPESYHFTATAGHTQTGPLLAAVDARQFSTPSSAASAATFPYVPCEGCSPNSSAIPHHPTVLYNWAAAAHQSVPIGSTTVLNHASFGGLMAAHAPSSPPPQCGTAASPTPVDPCGGNTSGGGDNLQEENTSSPHESGYYSGTTSPAPTTHHR